MPTIKRRRGDTAEDKIIVKSKATQLPIDVTGCDFVMYVTKTEKPDTFEEPDLLYQVAGVVLDGANGEVEFVPSASQAAQPDGDYFYEVKMTGTNGRIKTISSGGYTYF